MFSIGECDFQPDEKQLIWKSEEASQLSKIKFAGEVKWIFQKQENRVVKVYEQSVEGLQHECVLKNKWPLTVESHLVKYMICVKVLT